MNFVRSELQYPTHEERAMYRCHVGERFIGHVFVFADSVMHEGRECYVFTVTPSCKGEWFPGPQEAISWLIDEANRA